MRLYLLRLQYILIIIYKINFILFTKSNFIIILIINILRLRLLYLIIFIFFNINISYNFQIISYIFHIIFFQDEAFDIGEEMARVITEMNPKPMKLKFEKVSQETNKTPNN